ncbi:hypothetical protein [Corallococcus llansteffanensis]|uniref:B box-type domain-containing protein n=1 Tax=Corallococcus llansteffanensis TaxID=2316731 RepID=A0A3A8NMH2_9BACT|nr:hypothetical protein [Corallococcus llansteffanensis]RKH42365.1 hypothetical protein D7V93_37900 [Corallococcus llansteffanensis]
MSPASATLPDARCGQHPEVVAVALCARCGGFLCGACTEVLEETAYCEPCAGRRWRETRPSRAVQVMLGANVLGLLFLSAPVTQLSWTAQPGRMSGVQATLLQLGWTLAAGVGGTALSTWKLSRHAQPGVFLRGGGLTLGLRILAALNLLGLALWTALAVGWVYFFRLRS